MKFQSSAFTRIKLQIIPIILTATFLLLNSTPGQALWDEKIRKISDDELKEIKTELNLSDDPRFQAYSDSDLEDALNKEMDKDKTPALTYGVYILNAINEQKLVELCSKFYFDDKEATYFFSALADNLASWQENFAAEVAKTTLEAVIEACRASGVSIGMSTLFFALDMAKIHINIKKLKKMVPALWQYVASRKLDKPHESVWESVFVLIPIGYRNKQIEEYFKSLWSRYGKYILEDGLDGNFKQQQIEKLKMICYYSVPPLPLVFYFPPPDPPINLFQLKYLIDSRDFKRHGKAKIPVGDITSGETVILGGTVSHPDGDKVRLQIELRRCDEYGGHFDETKRGLRTGSLVESGSQATIEIGGLINGEYYWRARTVNELGSASEWTSFGDNPDLAIDFVVGWAQDSKRFLLGNFIILWQSAYPGDNDKVWVYPLQSGTKGTLVDEQNLKNISDPSRYQYEIGIKTYSFPTNKKIHVFLVPLGTVLLLRHGRGGYYDYAAIQPVDMWSGAGWEMSFRSKYWDGGGRTSYLYTASPKTSIVSVIDTFDSTVVDVEYILHPQNMVAAPDGRYIYIGSEEAGKALGGVAVIDTSTNEVVRRINTDCIPDSIAITPDGKLVVAAGYDPNWNLPAISVIGKAVIRFGEVFAEIFTDGHTVSLEDIAVAPDASRVYVSDPYLNTIFVITISKASGFCFASSRMKGKIKVDRGPHSLAITPDGRYLYVTNSGSDTVSVVDTSINGVISTIVVGQAPSTMAITPDGRYLYVTNSGSDTVSVVDTAVNDVVRTMENIPASSAMAVVSESPRTMGKNELVQALGGLKEAMLTKVKWDIENTAQAFTEVKKYLRARRWADIARPFLRILEDTIIILSKVSDLQDLNTEVNSLLAKANTAYEIFSIAMMIQDLQQIGEKFHCALSGPPYVSAIEEMLEEADATAEPGIGFDWKRYKRVIENYLYGTQGKTPVPRIPRRSTTAQRKIVEFAEGALKLPASIGEQFNNLILEIEKSELPKDFPIDKLIFDINELKKDIIWSTGYTTNIKYPAYLQGNITFVETTLGAIGHLYGDVFGEVAEKVAEKTKIETYVELTKLTEAFESGVLLLTIKYRMPGVEKPVKITQKITSLTGLSISLYERVFYSNTEHEFYALPQAMVFALPTELSNLWQIADDIIQYVTFLLRG